MTVNMTPSDAVGQRVNELRKQRSWSLQQLAEECAKVGAERLTANVLENIEYGRRDKDGRRRREITVDELLVLAYALDVPPFSLLLPDPSTYAADVTVTPSVTASWFDAARWLVGESLVGGSAQKAHMAGSVGWTQANAPLTVIRGLVVADQVEQDAYERVLEEMLKPASELLDVARRKHAGAVSNLYSALLALVRAGVKPPPLSDRQRAQILAAGFADVPPEIQAWLGGERDAEDTA